VSPKIDFSARFWADLSERLRLGREIFTALVLLNSAPGVHRLRHLGYDVRGRRLP